MSMWTTCECDRAVARVGTATACSTATIPAVSGRRGQWRMGCTMEGNQLRNSKQRQTRHFDNAETKFYRYTSATAVVGRRFAAAVCDALMATFVTMGAWFAYAMVARVVYPDPPVWIFAVVVMLAPLAYYVPLERARRRTLGRVWTRTALVDENADQLGIGAMEEHWSIPLRLGRSRRCLVRARYPYRPAFARERRGVPDAPAVAPMADQAGAVGRSTAGSCCCGRPMARLVRTGSLGCLFKNGPRCLFSDKSGRLEAASVGSNAARSRSGQDAIGG